MLKNAEKEKQIPVVGVDEGLLDGENWNSHRWKQNLPSQERNKDAEARKLGLCFRQSVKPGLLSS